MEPGNILYVKTIHIHTYIPAWRKYVTLYLHTLETTYFIWIIAILKKKGKKYYMELYTSHIEHLPHLGGQEFYPVQHTWSEREMYKNVNNGWWLVTFTHLEVIYHIFCNSIGCLHDHLRHILHIEDQCQVDHSDNASLPKYTLQANKLRTLSWRFIMG